MGSGGEIDKCLPRLSHFIIAIARPVTPVGFLPLPPPPHASERGRHHFPRLIGAGGALEHAGGRTNGRTTFPRPRPSTKSIFVISLQRRRRPPRGLWLSAMSFSTRHLDSAAAAAAVPQQNALLLKLRPCLRRCFVFSFPRRRLYYCCRQAPPLIPRPL